MNRTAMTIKRRRNVVFVRERELCVAVLFFVFLGASALRAQTSDVSRLIEVAGKVEFAPAGQGTWSPATNGLTLKSGDRLRTDVQSRAALQLSDRSIVRLNERTMLEIQPPVHAERKRFRLPFGSLFFF